MADRLTLGNTSPNPPTTRIGETASAGRGMGTYSKKAGTKPIFESHGEVHSAWDDRDSAMMARRYEESTGYPNLANKPFIQEQAKQAIEESTNSTLNAMEFLRNKWLVLYRLYRGESLAKFTYGRTPLHSPEPFKVVETMHPRIMRAIFGPERWFRMFNAEGQGDDNAKMQEVLCRDQLRQANYRSKQARFVRNGLIYGTAIQKTLWRQETRHVAYRRGRRIPNPERQGTSKVELEKVEQEELIYDGNDSSNVDIFDFYIPPNASSVDEAEWCADRSVWPDYKVKSMGELGHWINLQTLKDDPGTQDTSLGDEFKERKSYSYGVFSPNEMNWAAHIPHYEVFDWWGPLVVESKNGGYETRMCNIVCIDPRGRRLIVRVTEAPYWHQKKPFQAWRPITLEDEFYGIGPLEPIARLSMEKDMKRNLLMAATQLEANPMWAISDDANIPDGQLILQPGLTLRVPDPTKSIAPIHVPQVSDAALKAENVLTMDLRETAGTTSPQMGTQDPFGGSKTATQHTSEVDEANTRILGFIENYENDVIVPMLEQMASNNQQFMSYERVIREVGAVGLSYVDYVTVRPEDLIGRFIIQPLVSHRLSTKGVMTQQLVNLLDRAPVINQMYGPNAVKMPKLLAFILEHGFDIRNVDDFIQLPPEDLRLLTAIDEHECWYHGSVPPRRPDDNDMRHALAHMNEFKSERFKQLDREDPRTAAEARAHTGDHMRKIALLKEQQEKMMMVMQQQATMMGLGSGQGAAGAASPNQDPDSPQVRRNENERGEGGGGETQSEATTNSPNAGAS